MPFAHYLLSKSKRVYLLKGEFLKLSIILSPMQGSKLVVVHWSWTTKKSNGPAKYKFQWSAGPVSFNFSFFFVKLRFDTHNIRKQKFLNITYQKKKKKKEMILFFSSAIYSHLLKAFFHSVILAEEKISLFCFPIRSADDVIKFVLSGIQSYTNGTCFFSCWRAVSFGILSGYFAVLLRNNNAEKLSNHCMYT